MVLGHAGSGSSCGNEENLMADRKMTVIHINGVHEHCIRFCKCQGVISEHEQLFCHRLFSSTFDRPETAFTLDLLEYYTIDSMECKTSAQSFFQKLRRVTNNAFPEEVPVRLKFYLLDSPSKLTFEKKNRYQELIRVSRQMRKLQVSKRFGEVYGVSSSPGSLTLFCPSCPQPGINLPPDWEDLPSWVTRRTITVDGNFHADHIKMRKPEHDIMLTSGKGYMVEDKAYKDYLNVAKERRVVSLLTHWHLSLLLILQNELRGHLVGIIELSMLRTLTIEKT